MSTKYCFEQSHLQPKLRHIQWTRHEGRDTTSKGSTERHIRRKESSYLTKEVTLEVMVYVDLFPTKLMLCS